MARHYLWTQVNFSIHQRRRDHLALHLCCASDTLQTVVRVTLDSYGYNFVNLLLWSEESADLLSIEHISNNKPKNFRGTATQDGEWKKIEEHKIQKMNENNFSRVLTMSLGITYDEITFFNAVVSKFGWYWTISTTSSSKYLI